MRATSGSKWVFDSCTLSVSKTWSTAAAIVIRDSAQRKPWIIRSLSASAPIDCGTSTRRLNRSALRGSTPSPIAAERTWYSSSPS